MDSRTKKFGTAPMVSIEKSIVPKDKHDLHACKRLSAASDDSVLENIEALLDCLQDLNWPIAGPVAERLMKLDGRLTPHLLKVLSGRDDTLKYWIIMYLLHHVNAEVYVGLRFVLNRIIKNPTAGEQEAEVCEAAAELLTTRR